MSLLICYHDRKRCVIACDDLSVISDEAGVKQALPERVPKFKIVESASSQQKLIIGGVGRHDLLSRLMHGTSRMVTERGVGLLELSAILPHFARKAFAERRAIRISQKDDKIDLALIGYDHVGLRIRSFVWRAEDDFKTIETTSDLSNRIFALGAFDVSDETAMHDLTQHMVGAKHRHANWIAAELRDAVNEVSHRWPEAVGRGSFYAGIDSMGLIPLANEFVAPPEEVLQRAASSRASRNDIRASEDFGTPYYGPTLCAGRLFIGRILTAGRLFLGSIRTPQGAGAPPSYGSNDGGTGAQTGGVDALRLVLASGTGSAGNGNVSSPNSAIDGDFTTYCTLTVTANSQPNVAELQLSGMPGLDQHVADLTLAIALAVVTNNLSPASNVSWAAPIPQYTTIYIAWDTGINTTLHLVENLVPANTQAYTTLQVPLPVGVNLGSVRVIIIAATGSNQNSGSAVVRVYDARVLSSN